MVCFCISGLCPDWEDWDPKKGRQNAKEAMDAAEKWLDVPQVLYLIHLCSPCISWSNMYSYEVEKFPLF